jgi:hypothetical protein
MDLNSKQKESLSLLAVLVAYKFSGSFTLQFVVVVNRVESRRPDLLCLDM